MSKSVSEFDSEECSKGSSKNPEFNQSTDFGSIPLLKPGDDWNLHRACLEDYFNQNTLKMTYIKNLS